MPEHWGWGPLLKDHEGKAQQRGWETVQRPPPERAVVEVASSEGASGASAALVRGGSIAGKKSVLVFPPKTHNSR